VIEIISELRAGDGTYVSRRACGKCANIILKNAWTTQVSFDNEERSAATRESDI
jgi:hypothetical protein